MPPDKQVISNRNIYLILFFIAFMVVLCSSYNPLNYRIMYVDSSVYVTMAQGITRGYSPYKDLVDNKGPLIYLMSVPGLFLGGFTGVWITELILILVSVLFAYKTALFFGNQIMALIGTIFSFIALLAFFLVNAGTEEYSLPFLMISLYIFTKYFFSEKREAGFTELIALGACFASAVLIRLNMFPLWAGFCVVIFIETIMKRRFILLFKYIFCFCLGMIIIFIPVYLYLRLNGIIDTFIGQVIFAGASRGFGATNLKSIEKNFWLVLNRNNCALPLWLGIFWVIMKYKQPGFTYFLGYTFSYFLFILFLAFASGGTHYNMVLIPFFVPALTYLADIVHNKLTEKKYRYAVIAFFFCCMFAESFVRYFYYLTNRLYDNSWANLVRAGKMIDEYTDPDDKIISLGINGYIYLFTQRDTASRYFYQGSGLDEIHGAREEFISDILIARPAIIATVTEGGRDEIIQEWHAPIMEMVKKEYSLLSDENGYILYLRN